MLVYVCLFSFMFVYAHYLLADEHEQNLFLSVYATAFDQNYMSEHEQLTVCIRLIRLQPCATHNDNTNSAQSWLA